ncbi:hypothetical protein KGP36_06750 [Patescibacteria group bacterium]|nr:hypothetical protein [Patescibacteria group bacterium]
MLRTILFSIFGIASAYADTTANAPAQFPIPFANNAGAGYIATIPQASQIGITAGAASLYDGFPPLNFVPVSAGGVPPRGQDFNGILNEATAAIQWTELGGLWPYNSAFATSIGGYPRGALLESADYHGVWQSIADSNTVNPDTGTPAASWVPLAFNGVTTVSITTADVTLTPAQYENPVIQLTGTLTGNHNLILPDLTQKWTIINGTTGNYAVTIMAAGGLGMRLNQNQTLPIYVGYNGVQWYTYGEGGGGCASGFSRSSPHYCTYTASAGYSTLTLGTVQTNTVPAPGATCVDIQLITSVKSQNAVGMRGTIPQLLKTSSPGGLYSQINQEIMEQVATTNGTSLAGLGGFLHAQTPTFPATFYVYAPALDTNSTVEWQYVGYCD